MGCCFSTAKWKREEIPDHKFDFVDLNDYKDRSFCAQIGYMGVFLMTFRSVLMYMADISTAVLITQFNSWSVVDPSELANSSIFGIQNKTFQSIVPYIQFIYVGSIIVSFLLLALDTRKSMRIIKSRDISFAFTDTIAYRYYSLRSFPHWCFFQAIRAHHTSSDQMALFVFFRLKDWKRLMFAETPRHLVNFLFLSHHIIKNGTVGKSFEMMRFVRKEFGGSDITSTITSRMGVIIMAFVFTMYAINLISTIIASLLYLPLLCKIRGNLKEYVCSRIDKRIAELMRRKAAKRINQQHMELAMYGTTKESAMTGGPEAKLPVLTEYGSTPPAASSGYGKGAGGGANVQMIPLAGGTTGAQASPAVYASRPPPGSPSMSPMFAPVDSSRRGSNQQPTGGYRPQQGGPAAYYPLNSPQFGASPPPSSLGSNPAPPQYPQHTGYSQYSAYSTQRPASPAVHAHHGHQQHQYVQQAQGGYTRQQYQQQGQGQQGQGGGYGPRY
ncbi:hypothetical protein BCR44DRAFT_133792 [Catenaria anguillulae PL171]|uniref:Uncharacterized protein n=1 Tax=Catenaria anguillulae PL171 TaxID=765915 RepID=A0A1Y2H833_9FUNG|nr:hypothetical protein BCR44DRAFT_133792 [Catenaria anguillulae PL171]